MDLYTSTIGYVVWWHLGQIPSLITLDGGNRVGGDAHTNSSMANFQCNVHVKTGGQVTTRF